MVGAMVGGHIYIVGADGTIGYEGFPLSYLDWLDFIERFSVCRAESERWQARCLHRGVWLCRKQLVQN